MHIHDPSSGNTAKINNENKLETYAVMVPEASHISEVHGGSYAVYMKHAIVAANTAEGLGLITVPANAGREVKIQRIIFSHRMSTFDWVHLEAHVDPDTITDVGTVSTPINLNRGSNKACIGFGYHNGANDMDVTPQANDAGELLGISLNLYQPSVVIPYGGEFILRPGNSLYFNVKSGSLTGIELRAVVYLYEHGIE